MGHAQKIDFDFRPLVEDNYDIWKVEVKNVLTKMDLWKYVDKNTASKLSTTNFAEWEINNKTAKSTIMLTITNKILKELDLEPDLTASEIFEKINTFFGTKKNPDDVINILQQLLTLAQLSVDVDIKLALNNFFDMVNKLKDLKINLYKNNFLLSNILLTILPPSFKKFKVKILSNDNLPDVILLAIKILEEFDKTASSDDEDTEEDDDDEEEGEDAKTNHGGEKTINKNTSSEINDHNDDSGYNESFFPKSLNSHNDLCGPNDEEDLPNQSYFDLLYEMLNRQEYNFQNDNQQNSCLLPQIGDQQDFLSNFLRSTEEDRNHLQSLLKADAAEKSFGKSTTSSKPQKCRICRREGHNRRTCDKASLLSETSSATITPKRTYKCKLCGEEGHNKTTCRLNSSKSPTSSPSSSAASEKTYRCSNCGSPGHNIRTCASRKIANDIVTSTPVTTPKRTYTCSNCGEEGHNKTSCLKNVQTIVSPLEKTTRSYSCGICRQPGHNSRTCPSNVLSSSRSITSFNERSSSSSSSTIGTRSYSCGLCGGQGHNKTTCSLNFLSPRSSPRSSSYSYGGGGGGGSTRSYTCGNCGGSGHNSRTCR